MEVLFKVRRIERETIKRISGTSEKRASLLRRLPYNSFVFSAAFDGLRLAYGGRGGKIEVYEVFDPEDPEKMYTINAHSGSVMDLLRVEGKLFSCSRDATIRIRDGKELVRTLKGHEQCVRSIAYRDGNLMSVSMDGKILLRDLSTYKYKELKKHDKRVVHVRNYEDVFVCVSIDGYVRAFEKDKELFEVRIGTTGYGVSINRPYVAVSNLRGVTIVNAETHEIVKRIDIPATDTYIRRLSYVRDAIGVGGEFLYIIDDPLNNPIISPLSGHKHRIYNVVFEDFVFTCSLDRTLGIRKVERLLQTITESERESVKTLAFRCSDPGHEDPPERLVRMYKKRPVKALKIACGKYLKKLVERLEKEGLIVDGVSQVPPEDPESLEEIERVFL